MPRSATWGSSWRAGLPLPKASGLVSTHRPGFRNALGDRQPAVSAWVELLQDLRCLPSTICYLNDDASVRRDALDSANPSGPCVVLLAYHRIPSAMSPTVVGKPPPSWVPRAELSLRSTLRRTCCYELHAAIFVRGPPHGVGFRFRGIIALVRGPRAPGRLQPVM